MKPSNRRRKLAGRVRDYQQMKQRYPGMYHQPGSNKK